MPTKSAAWNALFVASLAFGCGPLTAVAADTVYLPCPNYKTGNSWRYREQNPHLRATSVVSVLSLQGDSISVGEKKTMTPAAPPEFKGTVPAAEQLIQKTLTRDGRTVFLSDMTMEMSQQGQMTMKVTFGPGAGAPECGDLPKSATYDQSFVAMGQSSSQQSTTVTAAVGRKLISVPAGEFDTYVVKRVTTNVHGPGTSPQAPPPPSFTAIYYAAANVGTVRIEMSTVMMQPAPAKGPQKADPEAQAALKQGLEALQKGEDPSAAFEKLEKVGEKAGKSDAYELELKPTSSTTITELESYMLK